MEKGEGWEHSEGQEKKISLEFGLGARRLVGRKPKQYIKRGTHFSMQIPEGENEGEQVGAPSGRIPSLHPRMPALPESWTVRVTLPS